MATKKVTRAKRKKKATPMRSKVNLELVRKRAYHIWEAKGRPNDSAVQDWAQAEQELNAKKR